MMHFATTFGLSDLLATGSGWSQLAHTQSRTVGKSWKNTKNRYENGQNIRLSFHQSFTLQSENATLRGREPRNHIHLQQMLRPGKYSY
jgi:hypothetical protein